ncbi:MAG: hypothetical protein ACOCRW_00805 [Bacteroidota bacterium]
MGIDKRKSLLILGACQSYEPEDCGLRTGRKKPRQTRYRCIQSYYFKATQKSKPSELAVVEAFNRGDILTPSCFNRATSGHMSPDNEEWLGNGHFIRPLIN